MVLFLLMFSEVRFLLNFYFLHWEAKTVDHVDSAYSKISQRFKWISRARLSVLFDYEESASVHSLNTYKELDVGFFLSQLCKISNQRFVGKSY